MSIREVRKVARGRIWTGEDALHHGLVDKLGGLKDAVHLAKQEAGLSQVGHSLCTRSLGSVEVAKACSVSTPQQRLYY